MHLPRGLRPLHALAAPAVVAALLGFAAATWADDDDPPISAEELQRIKQSLEAKGYRDVHDVEHDDGRYEVDAVDSAGHQVDLELDPKTLEILFMKRDD